jgi:hypothetical protein
MQLPPTTMPSPIKARRPCGTRHPMRRRGCFALALAAALTMAACGDIKIEPVSHDCPVENSCQHAGGR